jgi:hypothetical protein
MNAAAEAISNIQTALQLAEEHGLPVFPCRMDKRPYTAHGFKDATRDRAQITDWWMRWPDALVGVPTGIASGLLVVDIDPRGYAWHRQNADMLTAGRIHSTQRGQHLLYRYPSGATIGSSASKIADGVDVRGVGGYIIWWPAHGHQAVGELTDLTEPPDWLTELLLGEVAGTRVDDDDPDEGDTDAGPRSDPREPLGKISEGERNDYLSRIAFMQRKAGMTVGQIVTVLLAFNQRFSPPLADDEVRAIAVGKHRIKPDRRTVIELVQGCLYQNVTQAMGLLKPDAFVRAGRLVYIGQPRDIDPSSDGKCLDRATGIKREPTATVCLPLRVGRVRLMLSSRVRFMRYDGREKKLVERNCPRELAEIIAESADWPQLRLLNAIIDAPTLRPDMSVLDQPGYDAATGIWYAPSAKFPPIAPQPTQDDALAALATLEGLLTDFPFQSDAARAVALSHILTAALRPVLPTVPVCFYTASMAGTGKTLLARVPSLIAHSAVPSERPWPGAKDEELRKVLGAAIKAGDSELRFDNAPNGAMIDNPTLCAFATAEVWTDRLLGASDTFSAPNRCTLSVTGNNITPSGDLARRSLICRLELQAETTCGRTFRIDELQQYVRAHRPELLVGALTIVRAYALAGRRGRVEPLASFESWSRVVREPLIWLGAGDPVATQAEGDDGLSALQAAFAEIRKAMGDRAFAAAQLAETAGQSELLHSALQEAGCARPDELSRVSYWLRAHRGRIAGGLQLHHEKGRTGKWQLKPA